MAHIANTAFEARITNNEFEELVNIAGRYQESGDDAICSAGMLCVRNGLLPCEGFTGLYNENAFYMNPAASTVNANDVIYACNTYDWPLATAADGNVYAIGRATLGLPVPSGRIGNFTRVEFDNQHVYRFGVGNIDGTLTTETYFTINGGLLSPTATQPSTAGDIYFELRGTGNFTEGTSASFGYVDVVASRVVA